MFILQLTKLLLDLFEPPVGVKEFVFCAGFGCILPWTDGGGAPPIGIIVLLLRN